MARKSGASRRASGAPPATDSEGAVVVVAGDATAHWLIHTGVNWLDDRGDFDTSRSNPRNRALRSPTWMRQPGAVVQVREGGALLLGRMTVDAIKGRGQTARVVSYRTPDLRTSTPGEIVRAYTLVEWFPARGEERGHSVIRPASTYGFCGSATADVPRFEIPGDTSIADAVVLHDAGNGFRYDHAGWPIAVREDTGKAIVVLQLGRRIADNPLLDHVRNTRPERSVVIVDADDLRADGVSISRRLSWERTATDIVWQFEHNTDLRPLKGLSNVVIRLGLEGAVHYQVRSGVPSARLFLDPLLLEGGFREGCMDMIGSSEAFTAALTARVLQEGLNGVAEGIRDGVRSARRLFRRGFGSDSMNIDFPGDEVFMPPTPLDDFVADAPIPLSSARDSADPGFWCLLDELSGRGLEPLAHQILLGDETGLRTVPLGRFGDLRTVDRAEIESFGSIQGMIGQYLARRETRRPLCLAVFGPPGSGKSFGVEQVARSVGNSAGARVEKLEFNMSQLESTRSLVSALHRVRDEVVKGRVPLVFFDEFDSHFGSPLGWLRYFLAPMQDGSFQDGDVIHPIGKAIFVFAGGLSEDFARFSRTLFDAALTEPERAQEHRRFREAKGPDFVSRLRGFVNVKGPNPDPARPDDRFHLIRRAMIAKSLLERNWSSLRSPASPRALNIEATVVRALIGVPAYKHGVRSLEAVLEMSMINGKTEFDPAALPPLDQLEQHVDSHAFASLVLQGVLFAAAREAIAEAIHERYRRDRAADIKPGAAVLRPWRDLPESYRISNREQAGDVIRKLERIDCGYRPRANEKRSRFGLTKAEIEQLAELEHERWMHERQGAGYSLGPVRDEKRKTHPHLVAWSALPEKARQYDRDTVAAIPEFMAEAGFEVYRL